MVTEEDGAGLRERKKRLMRSQLSATATEMFLERGFDAVRVAEVAAACGVSEKTVFNYFPTKEALLLDRFDDTLTAVRAALAEPGTSPVDAVRGVLVNELNRLTRWTAEQGDTATAAESLRRFRELSTSTASLRGYRNEMIDRLTTAVAENLADRAGLRPDSPEPQIAAIALVGLWHVHATSLNRHLSEIPNPARLRKSVVADVQRAADAIAPLFTRFTR
jgi:AcrR family transcriptional regulator